MTTPTPEEIATLRDQVQQGYTLGLTTSVRLLDALAATQQQLATIQAVARFECRACDDGYTLDRLEACIDHAQRVHGYAKEAQ
jgi:hypothetical protein